MSSYFSAAISGRTRSDRQQEWIEVVLKGFHRARKARSRSRSRTTMCTASGQGWTYLDPGVLTILLLEREVPLKWLDLRQLFRYLVVGLEEIEVHKREGGLVFIVRFDEVLAVDLVEKRGSLVVSVSLARETIFLRRTEGVRDWFVDIREGVERSRRDSLPLLARGQERITLQELTRLYKEEEKGEGGEEDVEKERVWDGEVDIDSGNSSLQSNFSPSSLFGSQPDDNNKENKVGKLWAGGRTRRGLYVNTVQISHV